MATEITAPITLAPNTISAPVTLGYVGPAGADGADGADGPNTVTTTTTTDITGLLKGDGANVGAAVSGTDYLDPSNNLSDLDNASTARTNLGLGSGDDVDHATLTLTGRFRLPGGQRIELNGSDSSQRYISYNSAVTGAALVSRAIDFLTYGATATDGFIFRSIYGPLFEMVPNSGNGRGYFHGPLAMFGLNLVEKSADPSNPSEGESIIWQSDGTGSGDDGDIMIKITAGGVTKTGTLVDYSTL